MPILRLLLTPFSWIYYCGLLFDRWFRSRGAVDLGRPVVSIGNISVGGTGKTPLLMRLADDLHKLGKKAAVLTRGYRGNGGPNDETLLMIERMPNIPVGVGPDRIAQARALLEKHSIDVFLLDDGFQHWPISRTLDVVCVDATRPPSADALLPAGKLREPESALDRAGLVVITRSELAARPQVRGSKIIAARFDSFLSPPNAIERRALSSLDKKSVLAVSGIGNPDAFEVGLEKAGAELMSYRFSDHHAYTAADWMEILDAAKEYGSVIVTTEKDWVKLKAFAKPADPVLIARLYVSFSADDEKKWLDTIKKAVS